MDGSIERGPYGAQYLISAPAGSVETDYQMDILMQARPECLLPVHRQATVRGCRYAYPVTGLESLADRVALGKLDQEQAIRLVRRLEQDVEYLEDHLMMPEQALLDPESMFLEADARRLLLVYRPFLPVESKWTMDGLVQWLGDRLCRNRWQRRRWAARIAAELAGRGPVVHIAAELAGQGPAVHIPAEPAGRDPTEQIPTKSVRKRPAQVIITFLAVALGGAVAFGLKQYLGIDWRLTLLSLLVLSVPLQLILWQKRRPAAAPVTVPAPVHACDDHSIDASSEPAMVPQKPGSWTERLDPMPLLKKAAAVFRQKAEASPANQERMHDMPTQLLSSRQELFRLATLSEGMIGSNAETAGQRAFILNDEFLVGRDFRTVDLCLTGYAVGRQHARITRQGAAFFVTDLGSKNGTRLNGERLNKLQPYLLPDHCQLQFADRPFYFEAEPLPVGA